MSLDKDPTSYTLITYLWVILISAIGGVVSFMRKIRGDHARPFNITEFVGEVVTSGFVGVITFWLCESAHVNALLSAALIGVSGHMGSRALFMLENLLKKKYEL